jgi:hypothetical protein
MLIDLPDALAPRVAAAVKDACRILARDGHPVPAEWEALAAALQDRHHSVTPHQRAKFLAAARTARWRARKRGGDVPKRRPGPGPRQPAVAR